MSYSYKLVNIAKTRLQEIDADPRALTGLEKAQVMENLCARADDNHIIELIEETVVDHPNEFRSFLVQMFKSYPNGLSPFEAALYDTIAVQLLPWPEKAAKELQQSDETRDEAELRDTAQRYQDLKEEDRQYRTNIERNGTG